jgi:hypothetical protein
MYKRFSLVRIFEIMIPLSTWLLITMPIWLSPFHPAVVAYFIILFDVYFFYKTLRTVIFATISYRNILAAKKISWAKRAAELPGFKDLYHVFIIPNYKESAAKLCVTLQALIDQRFPLNRIMIVIAMEKGEGEGAYERAEELENAYTKVFHTFHVTFHTLLEGEAGGKASNETYAAQWVSQELKRQGISPLSAIVTSCDADSILDPDYCSYVATKYLEDKDGRYKFYWAPVLLYNNYWNLHFFIRFQTTLSSIVRLAFLSEKYNLIQISTYSMSMWLLESIHYWDTDIIPEDWHVFLQAFFTYGGVVQTKPIYLVTTRDGVRGKSFIDSFKNRYEQEKRWAWGVSDIPYALNRAFHSSHVNFFDKVFRITALIETHLLWPASFFLLTLAASVPPLVNPNFKRTVLGYLLPQIAGAILTLTSAFVLVIAYLDFQAKHKLLKQEEMKKAPLLVMQWILFPILSPIVSALLSSIPALESHTRLLMGKKMEYKVTKKI